MKTMHAKIVKNAKGKCYKHLGKCRICGMRFVVKKNSDVYRSKYQAKYYCKKCYKKHKMKDYVYEEDGKKKS